MQQDIGDLGAAPDGAGLSPSVEPVPVSPVPASIPSVEPCFSSAELAFLKRMAFHFEVGTSAIEAAKAVAEDDARLERAFFKRSTSNHFPTPDEMGRSVRTAPQIGDYIGEEISRRVYSALRGEAA